MGSRLRFVPGALLFGLAVVGASAYMSVEGGLSFPNRYVVVGFGLGVLGGAVDIARQMWQVRRGKLKPLTPETRRQRVAFARKNPWLFAGLGSLVVFLLRTFLSAPMESAVFSFVAGFIAAYSLQPASWWASGRPASPRGPA